MHDHSAANDQSSDSGQMNKMDGSPADERSQPVRFSDTVVPNQQPGGGPKHIYNILVVEDDPTLATLETDTLTAQGYTVVTVPSGELAITTLHHAIPDLVVLDLELTGEIHGWEVLQVVRSLAPIPVLITSSSVTRARLYMRQSGETRLTLDHLPKPYPLQALLKRIQRMLPISPTH
ncbi:response regulator transcription factor [Dictyobacter kobayashii]|uniref:Response regulatory domain-containing protein n=1 Tax=Dictyobacter kobayashii TaxID=2014872 RepID=A0A402AQ88_9CHLR|nr:response regulator [Dictyobacter kobayashii]GCE21199.1 hypothetical protein KDK_49990 [Dictyobacter kobayashii]